MSIDTSRVNALAIKYSTTGDERVFAALIHELQGAIILKAHEFATITKTSREDYQSLLTIAVWECLRDGKIAAHDTGTTNVMQRINGYWRFVLKRQQRMEYRVSSRLSTTAAKLDDVYNPDADSDGMQWADKLPDPAGDFTDASTARVAIAQYAKDKPTEYAVLMALSTGAATDTLAALVGCSSYDAIARKRVSRIRNRFREYFSESA